MRNKLLFRGLRPFVNQISRMFPSFSGIVPNSFEAIQMALDSAPQKAGNFFADTYEANIRSVLSQSGYVNFFQSSLDKKVGGFEKITSMIISGGEKVPNAEFDAVVYGNSKNFENFSAQFLESYSKFPPTCSHHGLIVEVKLNCKGLIDWAVDEKRSGNKLIFVNPENGIFCKAVVINGGEKSNDFVANMSLENPKEEYADCIKILKEARINVFYKLWASGETFYDLKSENLEIKSENREINERLNLVTDKLDRLEKVMKKAGLDIE